MQNSAFPASNAGSAPVPDVSEFQRESEAVEANLGYLEDLLQVLERRLMPVLAGAVIDEDPTKGCSMPSSPIGSQLRTYGNRVESVASRISYLLNQLALP